MKRDLRIIFMGTPQFAVPSLESLIDNGFNVVGVITATDKPAGRGREIKFSEVKQFAVKAKLPLLQPVNLKDNKFIKEFAALKPNLGIVVAFRMLPEEIWSFPEFGTFNLHASLLPQYRGAAPINHAIINGEKVTGLTTFFIKHEIDTGKIIFRNPIKIGEQETYGELHDRMMLTGAELVLKTAFAIQDNSYDLISQSDLITTGEIIKSAPKISKADCRINWNSKSVTIYNLIRGLNPVPAAFTVLSGPNNEEIQLKIFKASYKMLTHDHKPGEIFITSEKQIATFTSDGTLTIEELQMAGKKRLQVKDFLNGFPITPKWKMH